MQAVSANAAPAQAHQLRRGRAVSWQRGPARAAPLAAGRRERPAPAGAQRAAAVVLAAQAPAAGAPTTPAAGSDSDVLDVVVVGAGISGLVTAQALATLHAGAAPRVLVTESRDRVGGNITSHEGGGYIWETGPNSFQPNDAMLKAAVDAGVVDDLVFGDPTAPRFVYWQGRLRPTPSGLDALTFDLMTLWGKIRAGLGAVGVKAPMPDYEESVEQFIRRNLGDEVFYRLIEPFCSGVYAGNPSKLSMKAAFGKIWDLEKKGGSFIGGTLKLLQERRENPPPPRDPSLPPKPKGQTVGSFRRGLTMLPQAIADRLGPGAVKTSWELKEIFKEGGIYRLVYDAPEGRREVRARVVALTVPAYVAADLVRREAPDAAAALKSLDYPPVCACTLSYPESALLADRLDAAGHLPGFGQLHPRTQGVTTLGTIYSSSLFPGRAPPGQVLLLNYIGGALNRGILDMSEDAIVEQVDKDLRKMLLKPDAPPPKKVAVRVWPKAIPQFNVGHLDVVQGAQQDLAAAGWDGVLLGGNYTAGVALGKCVEHGFEYAQQIADTLAKQPAAAAAATFV